MAAQAIAGGRNMRPRFTAGVAGDALTIVESIGPRPRVFVRIVTGGASERLTLAETAAGHQAYRRESHVHRIFQLRFVTRIRTRDTMALSADLGLRGRRQTPWIQQFVPGRGGDMRTAGSMAALALDAGLHGS